MRISENIIDTLDKAALRYVELNPYEEIPEFITVSPITYYKLMKDMQGNERFTSGIIEAINMSALSITHLHLSVGTFQLRVNSLWEEEVIKVGSLDYYSDEVDREIDRILLDA